MRADDPEAVARQYATEANLEARRSLYENADPFRLVECSGTLDLTDHLKADFGGIPGTGQAGAIAKVALGPAGWRTPVAIEAHPQVITRHLDRWIRCPG